MGCSHTARCPLFPYLNASLAAWKASYCDDADGWRNCARYRRSLAGEPVPLALLPNGRTPVNLIPTEKPAVRRVQLPVEPTAVALGAAARPPGSSGRSPNRTGLQRQAPAQIDLRTPTPSRSWWRRLLSWLGEPV